MIVAILIGIVAMLALVYAMWRVNEYRPQVSADEVHMVLTPDLWRIRLCRYRAEKGPREPILFCHGFMSNQFNFALPAGDAIVNYLARCGYDCWTIDLRGAASSVPPFGRNRGEPGVDDHLLYDIPAAVKYIQNVTGFEKVHYIGHSMGGMLLYAYDAIYGDAGIADAVTFGSPIGFQGFTMLNPRPLLMLRKASGSVFRFGQRLLVQVLLALRPNLHMIPVNWKNMDPRLDGLALFNMVEIPPIPVSEQMMNAALSRSWRVKSGEVDVFAHLPELRVPLFAVFGGGDPFVRVAHCEEFFQKLANSDKQLLVLSRKNGYCADYNHVDLVMGRECAKEVFPQVEQWLRQHPIQQRGAQTAVPEVQPEEAPAYDAEPAPAPEVEPMPEPDDEPIAAVAAIAVHARQEDSAAVAPAMSAAIKEAGEIFEVFLADSQPGLELPKKPVPKPRARKAAAKPVPKSAPAPATKAAPKAAAKAAPKKAAAKKAPAKKPAAKPVPAKAKPKAAAKRPAKKAEKTE